MFTACAIYQLMDAGAKLPGTTTALTLDTLLQDALPNIANGTPVANWNKITIRHFAGDDQRHYVGDSWDRCQRVFDAAGERLANGAVALSAAAGQHAGRHDQGHIQQCRLHAAGTDCGSDARRAGLHFGAGDAAEQSAYYAGAVGGVGSVGAGRGRGALSLAPAGDRDVRDGDGTAIL